MEHANDRADELLQRHFDGTIVEAERRELLALWESRPELLLIAEDQYYVEHLLRFRQNLRNRPLVFSLNWQQQIELSEREPLLCDAPIPRIALATDSLDADELVRLAAASPALPKPEPEKEKNAVREARKRPVEAYDATKASRSHRTLAILLPLILAGFLAAVYVEWSSARKGDEHGFPLAKERPTPAILIDRDDVRWTGDTRPPELGEALSPGLLAFESGTVELLFFDGVRGIVEGPAELLLIDEKHVFCKRGRWSVTVPEPGRGFELQTPNLTVRDLGTRFYTEIEKDRCDVHVVEGTVETERADGTKTVFETGLGAAYRGGELLRRLSGAADGFLTRADMRRRSDATLFPAGRPEGESIERLKAGAVAKVDFSNPSDSDALLFGGRIVEGPEPDSKAFRFEDPTDRIRLNPAGKWSSMTVVVRIRVERLGGEMNPVLMGEGSQQNGIVWHIPSNGRMIVGLRQRSRSAGMFATPVVFSDDDIGKWVRLALTVDGSQRRLTVYKDGNPVFAAPLSFVPRINLNEVDLGSWKPSDRRESRIWHLDGEVAGALFYDRVLRLEEIRLLQQ